MLNQSFACCFMRGGTSKALMFDAKDLPQDQSLWTHIFLNALGSPDCHGRQLNGMGGGISSLSKVCIVKRSDRPDSDIDYTFAQVSVKHSQVDFTGNCGNMSSAVAPFALLSAIVNLSDINTYYDAEEQTKKASVRIFNTNTYKIIKADFAIKDSQPIFDGDFTIPGVSGSASKISLTFENPAGTLNKGLFPSGQTQQFIKVSNHKSVSVSMVDAGVSCVFILASDLEISADILPENLNNDLQIMSLLEEIRCQASIKMGPTVNMDDAKNRIATPKVAIFAKPSSYYDISEQFHDKSSHDIQVRMISAGQAHNAIPITGALATMACYLTEGTNMFQALNSNANSQSCVQYSCKLRIATPSGIVNVIAEVDEQNNIVNIGIERTAKLLMQGQVYI